MSQQAFEPQQEGQLDINRQSADNEMIQAQPYYWSTTPKITGDLPKNEHPSTFEDSVDDMPPIAPYSYQAQDHMTRDNYTAQPEQYGNAGANGAGIYASGKQSQQQGQQGQQGARRGFSPDGDAFEYGYHPYRNYAAYQAPWWTRPQRGSRNLGRLILLMALLFFFAKPLLWLLGAIFAGLGILVGAVLFFLLVMIVVLGIGMLIISAVLGRPWRPDLGSRRRSYRRSPWGW